MTKTYRVVVFLSIVSLSVFFFYGIIYQESRTLKLMQTEFGESNNSMRDTRVIYKDINASLENIQIGLQHYKIETQVINGIQTKLHEIYALIKDAGNHIDAIEDTGKASFHFSDELKHSHDDTSKAEFLFDRVKLLCWIPASVQTLKTKGVHVMKTWGKRCNKLIFFTPENVKDFPTVAIDVKEKGNYDLTVKIFKSLSYLYEHYIDDYDWFFKADTDSYVIVENLRYMLMEYDPNKLLYFGQHFAKFITNGYMSGGAGYVLSKGAVKQFGIKGYNTPRCRTNSGVEDFALGVCMQNLGVKPMDSRDSQNRTRFHCLDPSSHVHGKYPDWYREYDKYGATKGIHSMSDYAITFHYIQWKDMYNLEYFIYHLRPYGIISELQDLNRIGNSGNI